MVEYCGVCASEDYTASHRTEDGRLYVVCSSPFHGDEPRVWEPPTRRRSGSHQGIGDELAIWDKLLECVVPGEDFVPYGTVEDRFAERYPGDLARLIGAYGHRWRDPAHPASRYSASVYLGARLSELANEGHLEHRTGPAEGPWAYNETYEWWRRTGTPVASSERAAADRAAVAESADRPRRDGPGISVEDVDRVTAAARQVPPAQASYLEDDFVMNLFETVLDFQMDVKVVNKALQHFCDQRYNEIRTMDDLLKVLARFPDDQEGNTALAQHLWGYNLWTRAHQLRDLARFFLSIGVTDQEQLRAWAARSDFKTDFKGRVRGLGIAVYNWLAMRQGVDTVKPDVHVRRFAEEALGRRLTDHEVVEVVTRAAHQLDLKAYELDWRTWESSRGAALPYPKCDKS